MSITTCHNEASEPDTLEAVIAERLPLLDDFLATNGVELKDRPFLATLKFIDIWVMEIGDDQGRQFKPQISSKIGKEKWFHDFYQAVERWYVDRYQTALTKPHPRMLTGFVTLWGTAFELAVPRTVVQPDVPGETAWLRFPDSVRDGENSTSWLTSPPAFSRLSHSELDYLTTSTQQVATLLRSINVAIMGIPGSDETLNGLLVTIRSHLEQAAKKALGGGHPSPVMGCWDLQMACECALKALLHRKAGSFPKTHDLGKLYDIAKAHLRSFPADLLDEFPQWQKAVAYRYGSGAVLPLEQYWKLYCATLRMVQALLDPLVTLRLGKGYLKIARPPWKKED